MAGLTAREIELIDGMIEVQIDHANRCDTIANRAMAEKQKGWDLERVALLKKVKNTSATDPLLKEMAEALVNCEEFLSQLPTLNGFYGLALVEHVRTILQKYHERESTQC